MTEETQYRLRFSQRVLFLVIVPLPLAPPVAESLITRNSKNGLPLAVIIITIVFDCGLFIGLAAILRSAGVDLEDRAAVVRTIRHRRVLWDDVQAIEIQSISTNQVVVLVEQTRRNLLRAPITGPLQRDNEFEEKVEAIRRWWISHRSVDVSPPANLASQVTPRTRRSTSPGQIVQLIVSILLGVYAAFDFLLVLLLLVVGSGLRAIEVSPAGVVAVAIICVLEPSRSRIGRTIRNRRRS